MTYLIRPTPMTDFTCDALDDYTIPGHGHYAVRRDEENGGWAVRRLNATHSGGAEPIADGRTVVTALETLIRAVGEPVRTVFDPADHLIDAERLPNAEADDRPVMPAWVGQRMLYDPDEFSAHWREWAHCVLAATDRLDEGSLARRIAWHRVDIHRPDGTTARLQGEQAMSADYVIRRMPNAIALIADPANTPGPQSIRRRFTRASTAWQAASAARF